jgi:hypothetical protein
VLLTVLSFTVAALAALAAPRPQTMVTIHPALSSTAPPAVCR